MGQRIIETPCSPRLEKVIVDRLTPMPTGIPYKRIGKHTGQLSTCQQNEEGAIALHCDP